MAIPIPLYSALSAAFPALDVAGVKALIGGGVDADYIENVCAIRVSRALNYAGAPIPAKRSGLLTVRGADGMSYALRVREMNQYLRDIYGPPTQQAKGGAVAPGFRSVPGIILFDVRGWTNATGHLDLWDGQVCAYQGYWAEAFEVLLWAAPSVAHTSRRLRMYQRASV